MRPRWGPVARTALRAGLLGAGVVGGYLLLSLFAGPAHADASDDGIELGGLLGGLSLPEPADEPEAVIESVTEPVVDTVPAEPTGTLTETVTETATGTTADLTDAVTDTVTDAVADTAVAPLVETAGESVDQLVADVDSTVESTVDPITSTVDSVLPEVVAPVVDDVTQAPVLDGPLLDPPTGPLAEPVSAVDGAPRLGMGPSGAATLVDVVVAGQAPPRPAPPLLAATILDHRGLAPAAAASATIDAAAGTDHDPHLARPPVPLPAPSSHHLAGDSFDPGHPWPWAGPPTTAHEPDRGRLRPRPDIAYSELVMPVSAPPG